MPPSDVAPRITEQIALGKIWSAVRVNFCLLTHGDRQYVAYFNADRRLVVATRKLGEPVFTSHVLPSKSPEPPGRRGPPSTMQGWDSHNYLAMAIDATGQLHLSGNMHASPLLYFRTATPGDVTSLEALDAMVGTAEGQCTYPVFLEGPAGELIFHYRDGGSGNGQERFNVYDPGAKRWRRLLDGPLFDGLGRCSAYMSGPRRGPDGWYHLLWLWRDSPDAATNHDLSYARSRNLRDWETAAGAPLKLPLTPDQLAAIVDPVPVKGGIINGCHLFGFDNRQRVVVTYHKHDPAGNTQAYAARFMEGAWRIRPVSRWEGRHVFEGGGSGPSTFGTSLRLGAAEARDGGRMALSYAHWKVGKGVLVFDAETLEPLGQEPDGQQPPPYPPALARPQSDFPGMQVNWMEDRGRAPDPACRYVLRWETLGTNRDRARVGPLPENAELVLYRLEKEGIRK